MGHAMSQEAVLSVQTLGSFRVWRHDGTEISTHDWRREKARTLCQYLITRRHILTPKERIAFDLWPELDTQRADRDFKVALNALITALEPDHRPRTEPRYVQRQGSAYGLVSFLFAVDTEELLQVFNDAARVESSDPDLAVARYRTAVGLYKGDYLPDALYEDWASAERERLLTLYLASASRLAELLLERQEDQEAITLVETILARDRCWEEAYRVLMKAYERRGNRPQAVRAYYRCVSALRDELDLGPMPETTRLYRQIRDRERSRAKLCHLC
jgi:LuxR family maltose regulon positive regulatory protein